MVPFLVLHLPLLISLLNVPLSQNCSPQWASLPLCSFLPSLQPGAFLSPRPSWNSSSQTESRTVSPFRETILQGLPPSEMPLMLTYKGVLSRASCPVELPAPSSFCPNLKTYISQQNLMWFSWFSCNVWIQLFSIFFISPYTDKTLKLSSFFWQLTQHTMLLLDGSHPPITLLINNTHTHTQSPTGHLEPIQVTAMCCGRWLC